MGVADHGNAGDPLASPSLAAWAAAVAAVLNDSDIPVNDRVATRQPLDPDLTALAALATTPYGRALLELANAAALRAAAGLGDSATRNVGSTAGTVAAGDDARLTDPRAPKAHGSTHSPGSADPVPGLVATDDPRLSDPRVPLAHAASHAPGSGTDQIPGVVATTDPRLSDARTPTAHAASHATGGADAIAALMPAGGALGTMLRKTSAANFAAGWSQTVEDASGNLSAVGAVSAGAKPSAVNHVPRLARAPVPATGDLGMPGYYGSDTGVRELISWTSAGVITSNGFTFVATDWGPYAGFAGWVRIQRVGGLIYLSMQGVTAMKASPVIFFNENLPSGFGASDSNSGLIATSTTPSGFGASELITTSTAPWVLCITGSGVISRAGNASIAAGGTNTSAAVLILPTRQAWPAALPGTQVTPPAVWP